MLPSLVERGKEDRELFLTFNLSKKYLLAPSGAHMGFSQKYFFAKQLPWKRFQIHESSSTVKIYTSLKPY